MSRRLLSGALAAAALWATASRAQEFSEPAPAAQLTVAALLERGLPAREGTLGAIALATRWHGLAEIETRSIALAFGARSIRIAAGASQTGEAELGWTQASLAAGAASERYGFALRGCVRRRALVNGEGTGGEVGAGAWIAASPSVVVWATAPQLWTRGDPPPLSR